MPLILLFLGALLPGPGVTQVSVSPQEAVVMRGGSLLINCSSTCEDPFVGLETEQTKEEVASGPGWRLFELRQVDRNVAPLCYTTCGHKQVVATANITVYWFPERVELAPLPAWQPVGKNFTLGCQVSGGVPRPQLTVVLLRGDEELSRQPAPKDPQILAEVTTAVLARRVDHGANFSCRTELDLRPQGLELFRNDSAPRQLQTFILPETGLQLMVPDTLEVGTVQTLLCSLEGVFPASEAQIHMKLGDHSLNVTLTHSGDFVAARAPMVGTKEEEGTHLLQCTVELGDRTLKSQKNLTVYYFPPPNLTLSQLEVSDGSEVTVTCETQVGNVVERTDTPPGPPVRQTQFSLRVSPQDDGRHFLCSVALKVADHVFYKNQTVKLGVVYGPRLNEQDCLGNWTWHEKTQQNLTCQPWGNPFPNLTCTRKTDGVPLPIGLIQKVTWDVNGTYTCLAVSSRGTITREVFITVLPDHRTHVIIISVVVVGLLVILGFVAAYFYNCQQKIRKYELQKAQEQAAMKLKPQAT